MTRTELINAFIRRKRYKNYLQIGAGDSDWNFANVACGSKRCVIQYPHEAGAGSPSSDVFFQQNDNCFDLIFIDGTHEELQVDRDIENALLHLNSGGVIVLHDCLPPDEWHQRPASDYRPGENWNGAVWKSVLKYFTISEWDCYVVDCDWGCGVIDTSRRSTRVRLPASPPLEYERDFNLLRQFTLSESRFLAMLYGVEVFYHVAAIGNWKDVVADHLLLLGEVGLDTVQVSYVGNLDELGHVARTAAAAGVNAVLAYRDSRLTLYETPGIKMVEHWGRSCDGSALYFHTKGVSSPQDPNKRSWRELMNREVIRNWKQNVMQLDTFDIVGVNWRDCPPIAHFSGNFWWARSDWIRSLAPFDHYYEHPLYPSDWDSGRRLGCALDQLHAAHAKSEVFVLLEPGFL